MSADERREAILTAALPLFAQHGRNGVTTKQVADAAGVSEALLYKHFAGKEALYFELQRYCVHTAEKHGSLDGLEPNTASLVLGLYWLCRYMLLGGPRGSEYHQQIRRMILSSVLEDGDFARGFMEHNTAPLFERMSACLVAARESGDLERSASADLSSLMFAHALYAGVVSFGLGDPPVVHYPHDKEELLAEVVRFALRGLGLTDDALNKYFNPAALALLGR